jgi:hypothetical protein
VVLTGVLLTLTAAPGMAGPVPAARTATPPEPGGTPQWRLQLRDPATQAIVSDTFGWLDKGSSKDVINYLWDDGPGYTEVTVKYTVRTAAGWSYSQTKTHRADDGSGPHIWEEYRDVKDVHMDRVTICKHVAGQQPLCKSLKFLHKR